MILHNRSHSRILLIPAASLAIASAAIAQPTTLVLQGDLVDDFSAVTRIDNLAVNNAGHWIVEADTNNPDTTIDVVLIRNGLLHLREGRPLSLPPGASISSFDTVNLNAAGNSGWNIFLDGTTGGSDDSGIFFNANLVLQEGFISLSPSFSSATPYIGFFGAAINDSNQIAVMASVDDPALTSSVDRAIVILNYNAFNATFTETVLHKEGDILPGQTEPIADFGTGQHDMAFNNVGHVLFSADLTGDATRDGVIYVNSTLLAQEGSPSPVPGRNYASLTASGRAMNDDGEHVFRATLSGDTASDQIIIRSDVRFMQEGDSLPAFAPFTLTGFGSGPLAINDAEEVLWFGDWNDPDTTRDTGLFLNDQLLVQEGVTTINGLTVQSLAGVQDGYAMSPNGRFIIFEATLTDGFSTFNGAFMIDRGDCRGDFNGDGFVNSQDFFDFLAVFFAGC
ncbi:MAG: hypothetical protein H7210_04630 [Pyrinomonadaceae bacterium]|nr:hypothetical protein [Phycisphaerales bacterium]